MCNMNKNIGMYGVTYFLLMQIIIIKKGWIVRHYEMKQDLSTYVTPYPDKDIWRHGVDAVWSPCSHYYRCRGIWRIRGFCGSALPFRSTLSPVLLLEPCLSEPNLLVLALPSDFIFPFGAYALGRFNFVAREESLIDNPRGKARGEEGDEGDEKERRRELFSELRPELPSTLPLLSSPLFVVWPWVCFGNVNPRVNAMDFCAETMPLPVRPLTMIIYSRQKTSSTWLSVILHRNEYKIASVLYKRHCLQNYNIYIYISPREKKKWMKCWPLGLRASDLPGPRNTR